MSSSVATRILNYLQPRLNRRSVAFLLCLLLSGLFWVLTSLSKEYVDEVDIPITYQNLPDDLLIANQPTAVVKAKVKGFGFDLLWHWLQFDKLEIPVKADPMELASIRRKGREYHYILTRYKYGRMESIEANQLEILSITPDTLFLVFTPKFTKLVPVKLNAAISFSKQFGMVSDAVLVPDSILLIGPQQTIDTISFVLTEPQSWLGLNESLTAEVQLKKLAGLSYVRLSQTNVQVELNVVEFTEGSVTVPVRVESDRPETVKIFPSEVEIKYQVPLSGYDEVDADQFLATVLLNAQSLGSVSLPVSLDRQPADVKQIRIIPPQVEFIIQK
ncbi:MAG: hypothetical protein K9G41_04915 [Flavobacteriales bacterium]|nr:hypothetical protein [Flavobacteriales bacterium]